MINTICIVEMLRTKAGEYLFVICEFHLYIHIMQIYWILNNSLVDLPFEWRLYPGPLHACVYFIMHEISYSCILHWIECTILSQLWKQAVQLNNNSCSLCKLFWSRKIFNIYFNSKMLLYNKKNPMSYLVCIQVYPTKSFLYVKHLKLAKMIWIKCCPNSIER